MKKLHIPVTSILLVSSLIFQMSVIPDSLNIKIISRIVNIVILFTLFGLTIHTIRSKKPTKIVLLYIIPILFILIGFLMNLVRILDVETLGYASIFLPWLAALCIPFVASYNTEESWKIYYIFVLTTTVISLIEYYAISFGVLAPITIRTDRGIFLRGVISILYKLEGGDPYFRFYGVYGEPGTAAMFLLPALTYALVFSKKLAVPVFLLALYLTNSLGGFFGLLILVLLFMYWKLDGLSYSPNLLVLLRMLAAIVIYLAVFNLEEYFITSYKIKANSAVVREQNITKFLGNFSSSILENPLGFKLHGKSLSSLKYDNENYYGSTLSFYVAFVKGGILGLVGYASFYLIITIFTIKYYFTKYNPNKILACAFISLPSLLTFVFQRTTILDYMLFAFLFSVPLIDMIRKRGLTRRVNTRYNAAAIT